MRLPLLFSILATLAAAAMAYGVDSAWAMHSWGLGLIMMSRRMQWPLIAVSLIFCIALLGLVISGKRRAWWLIGLLPVLALFTHRFLTNPINRYAIGDEPKFVTAAEATFVQNGDSVVGIVFDDQAFAYPYACLYQSPILTQTDRAHRILLMWSPRANAATVLLVGRELKARDLDIAAEPADGLLIYDGRTGQFISAITGQTPRGQTPGNVEGRLSVTKTTWAKWKAEQPDTRVMLPLNGSASGPTKSIASARASVMLVGGDKPVALNSHDITTSPQNLSDRGYDILIFRDAGSGKIHAFDRHLDKDLVPRFELNHDRKRKHAIFIDSDTNSGWSADGRYIDGHPEFKGRRLTPLDVQEAVSLDAAKYWYKNLIVRAPATQPSTRHG